MSVGLALAEDHLAGKLDKEGYNVVDHYTYASFSTNSAN